MNRVLCPACFAKTSGEEKCCSHGTEVGAVCVDCGAVRKLGDLYWSCLGSMGSPVQSDSDPERRGT